MAVTRDWIPKQIDKFKIFADNLCERANKYAEKWHLDAEEVATLLVWQGTFNGFYKISRVKNMHSSQDIKNTKIARKTYQKLLRIMGIRRMKTNSFMTDSDKLTCGLNSLSNTYSIAPVAEISPIIDFNNNGKLGGKLVCIDPKSHKACKPTGQDGIKISFGFYKAGERKPLEAECTFTVFVSKCHSKIVFPAASEGMLFVGYARYYNTRNVLGKVASKFYGMVS